MGWRSRRASLIQRGDGRGQVSGQMATADTRENGQMALFVPMKLGRAAVHVCTMRGECRAPARPRCRNGWRRLCAD
jgi:hypothetical protein